MKISTFTLNVLKEVEMGRQEKIQENTVYHQRMINLSEVEIINQMYRSTQTEKRKCRMLIQALVPQLVRDINSEVGAYTLDCRSADEPIEIQKICIKTCIQGICETNIEKYFKYIRHYIRQVKTNVNISSAVYGFQKHRKNKVNTNIVVDIEIECFNVEDTLHIILEWCTDLSYKGEVALIN